MQHSIIQNMENLRIMNLLLESESVLELACHVICTSSDKLNEYQKERLLLVLKGCHEDETVYQPSSPPSPLLWPSPSLKEEMDLLVPEEKPDTLLENSCGICGSSYVDHGELACNDYGCLYYVRNRHLVSEEEGQLKADEADADTDEADAEEKADASASVDNWVQCNCCDSWRKIDTSEDLPEKWYCSDIKKACRVPREAERSWPARRAKKAVQFCYRTYAYSYGYEPKPYKGNRAPSHMECLRILAERKKITLEQLYKTSPDTYFGNNYHAFSRFMHGNAMWTTSFL